MQLRKHLDFSVLVKAVPQARPRGTNAGGFVRFYKKKDNADYEELIRYSASQAMKECGISRPTSLPVHLDVLIIKRPPDSWANWRKKKAYEKELLPTVKPDASNYFKLIEDALNGVAYVDDSQVVTQSCGKFYGQEDLVIVELSVYDDLCRSDNQ